MTRTWTIFLLPAVCFSQDALLSRGAEIFVNTCATGYCHGIKGTAGGAPRLAARGFTGQYIRQMVTNGGKEMPGFGGKLEPRDLNAVIAYVGSLNGLSVEAMTAGREGGRGITVRSLPAEAARGRALFFEATRGFGRCSTCHQVDGNGIAVAEPIEHVPESAVALRVLATPSVRTLSSGSESFPTEVVKNVSGETIVFDLTSPPPVRRTFYDTKVRLVEGSNWRHASVIQSYNDQELESILTFLRAVVKQ